MRLDQFYIDLLSIEYNGSVLQDILRGKGFYDFHEKFISLCHRIVCSRNIPKNPIYLSSRSFKITIVSMSFKGTGVTQDQSRLKESIKVTFTEKCKF